MGITYYLKEGRYRKPNKRKNDFFWVFLQLFCSKNSTKIKKNEKHLFLFFKKRALLLNRWVFKNDLLSGNAKNVKNNIIGES